MEHNSMALLITTNLRERVNGNSKMETLLKDTTLKPKELSRLKMISNSHGKHFLTLPKLLNDLFL